MSFDFQPRLKSDLLEIRPLAADDFDGLYAVAADPLVSEQHPDKNRWRPENFRPFFAASLASGGALTVVDDRERRVIGSSRYYGYDEHRSEVEIGWTFLARSHWGGVYSGPPHTRRAIKKTAMTAPTDTASTTDTATRSRGWVSPRLVRSRRSCSPCVTPRGTLWFRQRSCKPRSGSIVLCR
jgi:hypothetical protein